MRLFQAVSEVEAQSAPPSSASAASFPLALAAAGERVRIVELTGGCGMVRRLEAMGLRSGSEFEVLQREGPGGMLIQLAGTRLALGMGMLHRIRVCRL
ncbi:FeoA family protein [Acidihalobacter prosperus]